MRKIKESVSRIIGVLGVAAFLIIFVNHPTFPSPDEILFFLIFLFMIFDQALVMLKRLLPFIAIITIYESFRSFADILNKNVNYALAPHFDRLVFGKLPTDYLQEWLWRGHVQWYDFVLYIPYLLFFVLPICLALLVWKTREKQYWLVVSTYSVVFFAAFLTFLAFPSAPPWLASQNHYIEPIVRTSSYVWQAMGIHNFPSFYNHLATNSVAAVPSLHAACATLFSIFIFKLYGKRWGFLSLIYPLLIYVGVVYEAEHYAFDVFMGILYAFGGYYASPAILEFFQRHGKRAGTYLDRDYKKYKPLKAR